MGNSAVNVNMVTSAMLYIVPAVTCIVMKGMCAGCLAGVCSFIRTGKALHGMMISLFKVSHAPLSQSRSTVQLHVKLYHLHSHSSANSPIHTELL